MAVPSNMHDLFSAMQNDRHIKLFIGDSTVTLLIPESILIKTSDFFRGALKRGRMREGYEGTIYFPEDQQTPWEVLNFWIINGEVPVGDCTNDDLIRAWYLADKYQITQLKDDLMFELLEIGLDDLDYAKDYEEVLECTLPGSLPRKLFAELLMVHVKDNVRNGVKDDDFNAFTGNNDYAADILAAAIAIEEKPLLAERHIPTFADVEGKPLWLRYMTKNSKGPQKMWKWMWALSESGKWYERS